MATAGENARYATPPVRKTAFTVYFEPISIDVRMIGALQDKWATTYQVTRQMPPSSRPAELPHTDLFGQSWPMPQVRMATNSLTRAISYQFDQVSISWSFESDSSEANQYPGFKALSSELHERFVEFLEVVNEKSDENVVVQGCQCFYSNSLADVGALNWLLGFMSGWNPTVSAEADERLGSDYFGFRYHREKPAGPQGIKTDVWVQLDEGEHLKTELDIRATARAEDAEASVQKLSAEKAAVRLLDLAHAYENEIFESSFPKALKEKWGAKK